eukprot:NODE_213_length_12556_cov_0.937063.p3 type:complete len:479 gc:universal NODE_213_length_12556_cov_0.937063:8577-7141(-)
MSYQYLPLDGSSMPNYNFVQLYGYFIILMMMSLIFYVWFEIPMWIVILMTTAKFCWFIKEYDLIFGYWTVLQTTLTRGMNLIRKTLGIRFSEILLGSREVSSEDDRLLQLDALRGIASLIIASHHLFTEDYIGPDMFTSIQTSNGSLSFLIKWYGYTMVEVFVVLSGFIMAKVYWNEKRSNNIYTLIMNRLTRFFPLHVVTELCYVAVSSYYILHFNTKKKEELIVADFAKCISLTHIWSFIPHPTGYISVCNGPSWSLSVELLMNLIMFISIRYFPISWSLFTFECFAFLGYFAVDNDLLGTSRSIAIFYSFFLGVLVYKVFSWVDIKSKVIKIVVDLATLFALLNCVYWVFVDEDLQFISDLKLTTRHMTYFAIALIMLLNQSFLWKKFLSLKLFKFLGTISFALYLSHHTTLVIYNILIHYKFVPMVTNYFQVWLILLAQVGLASFLHFEFEKRAKNYLDGQWKRKRFTEINSSH